MKIQLAEYVTELAGGTPVLQLRRIAPEHGATIYAKFEGMNPTGSLYDRTVASCLAEAVESGRLEGSKAVVDAGCGDYGVALAAACAALGHRCVAVVPETSTDEAKGSIRALGAELVLSPGPERLLGAIRKAREVADSQGAVYLNQHESPAAVAAHRATGEEIVQALGKEIDAVVAGVTSGASLRGIAECLREKNPRVQIFAVEPSAAPVLSGGAPAHHRIEGLGAGFIPPHHRADLVNGVLTVSNEDAFAFAKRLAKEEGILASAASGAVAWAAAQVAGRMDPELEVVAVLPSSSARHLSTGILD